MQDWSIEDATARFDELLDACLSKRPQVLTRRGVAAAVLVSIDEWHRLQAAGNPSLKRLLLADSAGTENLVPARGKARRRQPSPVDFFRT